MSQARTDGYSQTRPARRTNRAGCVVAVLTLLVLLALIIGIGFVFIARPYVQSQLDQALGNAVDQIPDAVVLLPPGPISINNDFITNIIAVNLAPSDPIKNPKGIITPQGVEIDVDALGQPCSIQGLPETVNGQLKATNVQVGGLLSWFISPDEATTLINRHLNDAQAKLKHSIDQIQLQNGTLTITLGPPILP
jgi:hypothetical protein